MTVYIIDINDKTLCFGGNSNGQLGDPNLQTTFYQIFYTQEWTEPKLSSGSTFTFKKIYLGESSTCGIDLNDDLYCWGYYGNGTGEDINLSTDLQPNYPRKVNFQGYNINIADIKIGYNFSCILSDDNSIYCWGSNNHLQLGRNNFSENYTTVLAPIFLGSGLYNNWWNNYNPTPHFIEISLGRHHICAITNYSDVHCWGENSVGQLGDDLGIPPYDRPVPAWPVVESLNEYYGP